MNNEILQVFSLTILLTIKPFFVLSGLYILVELLKWIFSPKINYDVTKHYNLICESNRLFILNSSLEEKDESKSNELAECYRNLSSQLYFQKLDNFLDLIQQYLYDSLEVLVFVSKIEDLILIVGDEIDAIEQKPKRLYQIRIIPGVDESLDLIIEKIYELCTLLEWEMERTVDQIEVNYIQQDFRFEITELYESLKKYKVYQK